MFNISANTARSWHKRYKNEGHCNPRPRLGKVPRIEQEDFENYMSSNMDKTLPEIGAHFGMTGSGIAYYMKKFGYSYRTHLTKANKCNLLMIWQINRRTNVIQQRFKGL